MERDDISIEDALQRFETIWEHVECGITMVDAETRKIVNINPVAARMFGDNKEKIVGKKCHQFICPAPDKACPIIDKGLELDRAERVFIKADGTTMPIVKSAAKIMYNGRLTLLESFSDISKVKDAEQQLSALKIAEAANHAKSDFLSRMSHEMRTPLTAILGMTQISENTEETEKLKYCLSNIDVSAQHMLGLINDILDMSKIEAGKLELENALLNIENILSKIIILVTEKTEEKNIKFRVSVDHIREAAYFGDELRLSQVIANIVSNAVKFTPPGGQIYLKVKEISRTENRSKLCFSVKDSGIGMKKEQVERLFKPFEQADTSISRQFGGTGLGLAISRKIVEKMNGQISVKSAVNKGSEFSFEVELERAVQEDAYIPQENGKLSKLKVLVIAEDEEDRGQLTAIADRLCASADMADTGEAGKKMLGQADAGYYDIVIVDYGVSGLDIQELRKRGTNVLLTGSFSEWSKNAQQDKTGFSFISKPVLPSVLRTALQDMVAPPAEPAAAEEPEHPDFSDITLLLVDDVAINREIIINLLQETRINIVEAENGMQAIELIEQEPSRFQMIIMDVQMPVMDGLETTGRIRSLNFEAAGRIPIIAMTANVFKEDVERCLKAGMNGHLAKPINIETVKSAIIAHRGKISEKP